MQTFSRDVRYPALYQLFPSHEIEVLIDVKTGPQDIYDPCGAAKFGLDVNNLRVALKLQKQLDDFSHKPVGVQYVIVAASGQSTHEKIQYDGTTLVGILKDDAGDGSNSKSMEFSGFAESAKV